MVRRLRVPACGVGIAIVLLAAPWPVLAQTQTRARRSMRLARKGAFSGVADTPNFPEKTMRYLEERPLFGRDGLIRRWEA